ncbi:MAG: IS21 family transposase [bacterium]|nr:IS21 family transposase [bacterium]
MKLRQSGQPLSVSAAKAGMDEKTARKYLRHGKLPSQCLPERTWRTREDPFREVWDEVKEMLALQPGLQAKTVFAYLQRQRPGRFADGQLRTLQRRMRIWRALEGPSREVFFAQRHDPGRLGQSDFTDLASLGVTIAGELFPHLLYHFVLTYSNWENGTVCFSESFESLSAGLQNALWKLGKVPIAHQTDRMTAAVHKLDHPDEFTARYRALLGHYDLEGKKIQARKANENGDVEQRHHRIQVALDQALMLRGSREFASRFEYEAFLEAEFDQANAGRRARLDDELSVMRPLPRARLNDTKRERVRVRQGSTIRVSKNTYSVPSRLIGEQVDVRIFAEVLEVWYAQRRVEVIPRLRGTSKHRIQYRHIIDWLVRKPGAFANYRYREDLFPTTHFRMAYDLLCQTTPARASKEYLQILELAARESEVGVDVALHTLLTSGASVTAGEVKALVMDDPVRAPGHDVDVEAPDLGAYDALFSREEVAAWAEV